ncbi:MAG: flagellar basal body-associated protein FliL [Anaerobacillus sp.]|uniref:flagellar basal body-associated protein FliL n=1 Tax=Anaerobacillus sp. TaxID=1872506 RepID=UPI00391AFEEB
MFKNKLVNIMLIILVTLTLIGGITLVLYFQFTKSTDQNNESTIDEILALSVDTNEITTNLLTNDFIRVTFKIQVDNAKAKKELEKRDFQVRNIIIRELSGMRASDFSGSLGIENLENIIQIKINEYMQEGVVMKVYTTGFVLQ